MRPAELKLETYQAFLESARIGRAAVRKAQEESRSLGVPNVYSILGTLYWELPDGTLSKADPWSGGDAPPSEVATQPSSRESEP